MSEIQLPSSALQPEKYVRIGAIGQGWETQHSEYALNTASNSLKAAGMLTNIFSVVAITDMMFELEPKKVVATSVVVGFNTLISQTFKVASRHLDDLSDAKRYNRRRQELYNQRAEL